MAGRFHFFSLTFLVDGYGMYEFGLSCWLSCTVSLVDRTVGIGNCRYDPTMVSVFPLSETMFKVLRENLDPGKSKQYMMGDEWNTHVQVRIRIYYVVYKIGSCKRWTRTRAA